MSAIWVSDAEMEKEDRKEDGDFASLSTQATFKKEDKSEERASLSPKWDQSATVKVEEVETNTDMPASMPFVKGERALARQEAVPLKCVPYSVRTYDIESDVKGWTSCFVKAVQP